MRYYDLAGRLIDDIEAAKLLADADARRVALDRTSVRGQPVEVSTVFLVLDHGYSPGPPVLWETLIFGGPDNGYAERYTSEDSARAGHELILATYAAGHVLSEEQTDRTSHSE